MTKRTIKQAFIKAREDVAAKRHAPQSDHDRLYFTQLAIFDALVKFADEAERQQLSGPERYRRADARASQVAAEVAKYWRLSHG